MIERYDVIIIGAGSVGTPTALALANAGVRTLVLDGRASVGQGSNKAAIGGVRATHSDPAKIRLNQRSLEILSSWEKRYGDAIGWQSGGYVFVAYREEDERVLGDLLVIQHSHGLNIDWLDRRAMLELLPDLSQEGLRGGTYSPEDGNCSSLLTLHAFYRRAREAGATFRFGEPVVRTVVSGGRVCGVATATAEYGADVVINAAGAQAATVGAMVGLEIPVRPDSHEAAITEPVAQFLHPMIVDIRPAPGSSNFYFYQSYTGQVILCITPSPSIWGDDTRETSDFLPMISRRVVELMPRLHNIRVRRTWRGLYPMTPDGSPLVGWAGGLEGYLLAVGMCGQGFMLGPGIGELLARMVLNRLLPEDEETLRILSPMREFRGQERLK